MNLDKIIEWANLKSTVIFLVEQENTALKRAVYFNVVESMSLETRSRTSNSTQSEGNTERVMANLPRSISLSGWLSFNSRNITQYLTDVVMGAGKYVLEFEPLRRKAILEEWKENKTLLTLFGIEEKNESLVISSIHESKSAYYSTTSNINLSLSLVEISTISDTGSNVKNFPTTGQ